MMTDLGHTPQRASFQPDVYPTDAAARWKKWLDRFENLIIAVGVPRRFVAQHLLILVTRLSIFATESTAHETDE